MFVTEEFMYGTGTASAVAHAGARRPRRAIWRLVIALVLPLVSIAAVFWIVYLFKGGF